MSRVFTVFSLPGCSACEATRRYLLARGQEVVAAPVSHYPQLVSLLSAQGRTRMPFVVVRDDDLTPDSFLGRPLRGYVDSAIAFWSGLRPDLMSQWASPTVRERGRGMSPSRRSINFASGPVRCGRCRRRMRPTARAEVWPPSTVVYGRLGLCQDCAAPDPTPVTVEVTPRVMPRRRPHRRFDYRPDVVGTCPACGTVYDPVAGVCRCNDKH